MLELSQGKIKNHPLQTTINTTSYPQRSPITILCNNNTLFGASQPKIIPILTENRTSMPRLRLGRATGREVIPNSVHNGPQIRLI